MKRILTIDKSELVKRDFWSAYGGSDCSPKPWYVEFSLSERQHYDLLECRELRWRTPPQAEARRKSRPEDCAYLFGEYFMCVSTKFRALLEAHAPRQAQYLPVEIMHKGTKLPFEYWIVNPLLMHECIDDSSPDTTTFSSETTDIKVYSTIGIDSAKVPPTSMMFRVKDYVRPIFVRTSLALAIVDSGMKGCCFVNT